MHHAQPGLQDLARHFDTRAEGQRWLDLVVSLDDEGVGEVDTTGVHLDLHFTRRNIGAFNVIDHQRVRIAERFAEHCFHRMSKPPFWQNRIKLRTMSLSGPL